MLFAAALFLLMAYILLRGVALAQSSGYRFYFVAAAARALILFIFAIYASQVIEHYNGPIVQLAQWILLPAWLLSLGLESRAKEAAARRDSVRWETWERLYENTHPLNRLLLRIPAMDK